jgi:hypothetical protein
MHFGVFITDLLIVVHEQINIVEEFPNIARNLTMSFANMLIEGPIVS